MALSVRAVIDIGMIALIQAKARRFSDFLTDTSRNGEERRRSVEEEVAGGEEIQGGAEGRGY